MRVSIPLLRHVAQLAHGHLLLDYSCAFSSHCSENLPHLHFFHQRMSTVSYILYRDLALDPSFPSLYKNLFCACLCLQHYSHSRSYFNPHSHGKRFVVNFSGTDLWVNNWALRTRVEPSTMAAVCLGARERLVEAGRWGREARRMAFVGP